MKRVNLIFICILLLFCTLEFFTFSKTLSKKNKIETPTPTTISTATSPQKIITLPKRRINTTSASQKLSSRLQANLDLGWRFKRIDRNEKESVGWELASFPQETTWKLVDLPHDIAIDGSPPFTNETGIGTVNNGFLACWKGYYRKSFVLPSNFEGLVKQGNKITMIFDGIQRRALVWINGKAINNGIPHESGYIPLRIDITDLLMTGKQLNTIAVSVDCSKLSGWWYEGGGIYRSVWLETTPKLSIDPWGIHVLYDIQDPIIPPGPRNSWYRADVNLNPQISLSDSMKDIPSEEFWINARIYNSLGFVVSNGWSEDFRLGPNEYSTKISLNLKIKGAALWSPETPELYIFSADIIVGTEIVDSMNTTFGMRRISFDANSGMLLNGKHVLIKGMCNHQDFAGIGVAVPDNFQMFRVSKMKELGANAWRAAHNPPNTGLLDACDKLGLMVWDENHMNSVGGQYEDDLKTMVLRDRNHPSVILWSLCNEKLCNNFDADAAKKLKKIILSLDSTRPITAAIDGQFGSDFQDVLDIIGVNYHSTKYDQIHSNRPNIPMIASETASSVSDRGIYFADASKCQVPAYDTDHVKWGDTAKDAWSAVVKRPFIAGCFVWTGFDYKGEPSPFKWPSVASHFGVVDSAGFEKDNFYYYKNVWKEEENSVHILPHWNWYPGWKIAIWTYSNGDQVEVFVNGKSIGKRFNNKLYYEAWENVEYESGNISAISYLAREKVAEKTITTTGPIKTIKLEIQTGISFTANGHDLALVKAFLVDKNGNVNPIANNRITFTVYGQGILVGVGNGDPNDHTPDKVNWRNAFNGKCIAIVKSIYNQPGNVFITAKSGVFSGQTMITSKPLLPSDPFHNSII